MNDALDLIAMGHVIKELIVFPDRESDLVLGSPAAYSSLAMARLGARVGLVTRIGPDMPDHLLRPFHEAGVDRRGLRVVEGETTTATRLVYDASGNKTIEYPAKASPLRLEDIPEAYRAAPLFYICAMDHDVPMAEIKRIAAWGREMAVDLGGYGGAHVKPAKRAPGIPDELPELVSHFHLVKASDEDCRRLTADPDCEDEALGRRILGWGARVFVATRGGRGALILTKERRWEIPPFQGNVIDPTGGGDAFMAGFLVAWQRTRDLEYAGRHGGATALCVIEQTGGARAERMPTALMVETCLRRPTARMADTR